MLVPSCYALEEVVHHVFHRFPTGQGARLGAGHITVTPRGGGGDDERGGGGGEVVVKRRRREGENGGKGSGRGRRDERGGD